MLWHIVWCGMVCCGVGGMVLCHVIAATIDRDGNYFPDFFHADRNLITKTVPEKKQYT